MIESKMIAFLGAGSMAEAMISGMVKAEIIPANQIVVTNGSNEERLQELKKRYGIRAVSRGDIPFENIDILILAMKPKDARAALYSIEEKLKPHQLILSVLAGISTSYIEDHLPKGQQVIRVMPNTSSAIGESATAISLGEHATGAQLLIAKKLLEAIGSVYILEESKMDVFTGIAGSGPAYFYYLMEHIEKAGIAEGMDVETVRQIGAQTILGAAKMMLRQDDTPAQLKKKVTSPNGTTAAGLEALEKFGGGEAIYQAVKRAARRSEEISSQLQEKVYNS